MSRFQRNRDEATSAKQMLVDKKEKEYMNNKPVLVIMAAGMGSRYGGLKQIDKVDDEGDKIIDFSIYDAKYAGFSKIIFSLMRIGSY